MTSTPYSSERQNMKLKIALLSVAMSSAYIFSGSVFAAEKYEIAWLQKSMVSHGLTGWGWRKGSCR
jgi:hypothetical protein